MHRTFTKLLSNRKKYELDNDKIDVQDSSLMMPSNGKKKSKFKKNQEKSPISVIHSFLPQLTRFRQLKDFKNQRTNILFATDIVSRGIDIKTVDIVIHYDIPYDAKNFVHRVGRAARNAKLGLSIAMITQYDLEKVKAIESIVGEKMTEEYADFEYKKSIEDEEVIKEGRLSKIATAKKSSELEMGATGENEVFEKLRKRKDQFRAVVAKIREKKKMLAKRKKGKNDSEEIKKIKK